MRMIRAASIVLAGMLATTGLAVAGQSPTIVSNHPTIHVVLSCKVAGSPVEFPSGIAIVNGGYIVAKKGTTVHWSIPSRKQAGTYVLTADLSPGHMQIFQNPNGEVEAGTACKLT